jgi:hypothetical protein
MVVFEIEIGKSYLSEIEDESVLYYSTMYSTSQRRKLFAH